MVSSEHVESKDVAVLTFVHDAKRIRMLFGRTQLEWLHAISGRVLAQMREAERITAVR
jgi:hypothetical protein